MKTVIQRVSKAFVKVDGEVVGSIGDGFLVLVGVNGADTEEEARLMAKKVANLRVFCDEEDKMNLSLLDKDYSVLAISNFTLCADTKKGNRPSFINAMEPQNADRLYNLFCDELRVNGVKKVEKGVFGADMKVELLNDGPITIVLDTDIWSKK